jgi:cell wall-associated NlpC family hydrolase
VITAADVVVAAHDLMGTPFRHQGRQPGQALDCAGVVISVARQLGIVAPDFDITGYRRLPDGVSLRAYCDEHLQAVAAPRVGGVVLVSFETSVPHHLGIVVPYAHGGALSMIHAESQRHRRVIETRLLFGRTMRLQGAYVFPGVA